MQTFINAIEKHRNLILETERYIWKHPETGYREYKTSKYLETIFEDLGYDLIRAGDIPGFYTIFDTGRPGPEILIMGELDSLICPNHPESDPKTGYVHACGHNAQCAALVGIAAALKEPGVCDHFCGRIRLCAVPAEELIEIGYRSELKRKGIIRYFGGKGEFLYRGYFDGVDIAFMLHASSEFKAIKGAVGFVAKTVHYKGVSAHGATPSEGRNALYAATQGLSAANAIRENFHESDIIRFHPIITHGGEAVNAIPELVTIESYVRGNSFEAISNANKRINQALCGGALSLGTNIEIIDTHGYAPLRNDENMIQLTKEAALLMIPEEDFKVKDVINSGSTDMAELCGLMPVIHPYTGGTTGTGHGADYYISDPERACVKSAKLQLGMLHLLLANNAIRAQNIISEFKPVYKNKEAYFAYIDSLYSSGERITYKDDGTAEIRL